MSRSGYSDDCDGWDLIRWRGQVASALRGKRGQRFLQNLATALDALVEKKLIAYDLQDETGAVCALGSVGLLQGIDLKPLDPYDHDRLGMLFDIAPQLVQEIEAVNDEICDPAERWDSVKQWARENLKVGSAA